MLRPSALLPILVAAVGVGTFGVAMAQSSLDGSGNAASAQPAAVHSAYSVCTSNGAPDPQDCYPPNRQGKRNFSGHTGRSN
jgi:hypothetical protein